MQTTKRTTKASNANWLPLLRTLTLNVDGETGGGDADRILGLHSIGGRVRTLDVGHVEKRVLRLEAIGGDLLAVFTVPSIFDLRGIRRYR